ncbi:Cytochrome P450 - like 10 [Theobroma cacao]|nr:Cytochrome P450 - like 10 [Theobroma cacao]
MENQLPFLLFLLTLLFVTFRALRTWTTTKSSSLPSTLPPGPPKLPLIGNLHLLIGTQPHRCLARLAQKYGPVMLLQLGEVSTVVISSPEAAKQVMKTHDSVFSERPYLYAAQFITYNFRDIAFARGDYMRQIRKICVLELLSKKRVQSFRPIREEEISNLVRTISSKAGSPINLKNFLYSSALSILSRTAFGGKCKHQDAFKKHIPDIIALFGGLSIVDVYPSVKLLHLINAMRPKIKKLHNKVDEILESDMFLGGGETSSTVVEWAMSELLRNPEVLKRAQAEVRHVFAGRRDVDELGIHELKYLRLVIKETLRLHPTGPLLLPRECQVNCEVNGCVIPAKSRVIVNVWAIGQDQNYWAQAEKFYPERFCDSSINYKGTDFEFIPFGAGRRMCPGMSYGIASVELLLANLLYHFDWKLPNGKKPEDLDMTELFGATLQRKEDLCLVPIPHHL